MFNVSVGKFYFRSRGAISGLVTTTRVYLERRKVNLKIHLNVTRCLNIDFNNFKY